MHSFFFTFGFQVDHLVCKIVFYTRQNNTYQNGCAKSVIYVEGIRFYIEIDILAILVLGLFSRFFCLVQQNSATPFFNIFETGVS